MTTTVIGINEKYNKIKGITIDTINTETKINVNDDKSVGGGGGEGGSNLSPTAININNGNLLKKGMSDHDLISMVDTEAEREYEIEDIETMADHEKYTVDERLSNDDCFEIETLDDDEHGIGHNTDGGGTDGGGGLGDGTVLLTGMLVCACLWFVLYVRICGMCVCRKIQKANLFFFTKCCSFQKKTAYCAFF